MKSYEVLVFPWNPNGTNDIAIIDERGIIVDSLSEALFGYKTRCDHRCRHDEHPDGDPHLIDLQVALRHVAVSPVSDGKDCLRFLAQYFALTVPEYNLERWASYIIEGKE